jgi:hypothetical protein
MCRPLEAWCPDRIVSLAASGHGLTRRGEAQAVPRNFMTRSLARNGLRRLARGPVAMRARVHTRTSAAAARRGLEPLRASRAPLVLGRDHLLSRMAALVRVLAWQMAAVSGVVVVGGLGVAGRRAWGIGLLCAALVTERVVLMACALARQLEREHVLRLIASGRARLPVAEISRQAQRLVTPRHRAQLAERLERALDKAACWHRLPAASRLPAGIRLLCAFAPEVRAIAGQLRGGQPALPGVALLELLLTGGYGSALYAGDNDLLREHLWRIRYLICPAAPAEGAHRDD